MRTRPADVKLARVRRGVSNPERSAELYAWLFGLAAESTLGGFRLHCANGELIIHSDASTPVAIELDGAKAEFDGRDPDGVPVLASQAQTGSATTPVILDHVRLICADLAGTIRFYRQFGLVLTWSGRGETFVDGYQEAPVAGADWVHLSGSCGYLSLSQADWLDFGVHNQNSGPPRFVHIGFAAPDLGAIIARLEDAGMPCFRAPRESVGERLYLNDPDGDPRLGNNVEIIQYQPGSHRSGVHWPDLRA